jgi:carbohydrate-binding DOMON domain-containing protein
VVDGDLDGAQTVTVAPDGRWRATLATAAMIDPALRHRVVVYDPEHGTASAAHTFTVRRQWILSAESADPANDDHGPSGRYTYPTDSGWADNRQADLRGVRVWRSGGALKIELRTAAITTAWNPANGFDRVAFTLFLELPGQAGGVAALPQLFAEMPAGLRWHRRLRVHGWSNALFAADGADAQTDGRILPSAAKLDVDRDAATITFTLPPRALGDLPDLRGTRLYVTTWDYDGGYRPLRPQPDTHAFGGGADTEPRIMDDALLELR